MGAVFLSGELVTCSVSMDRAEPRSSRPFKAFTHVTHAFVVPRTPLMQTPHGLVSQSLPRGEATLVPHSLRSVLQIPRAKERPCLQQETLYSATPRVRSRLDLTLSTSASSMLRKVSCMIVV
jgi:hypothetical protein